MRRRRSRPSEGFVRVRTSTNRIEACSAASTGAAFLATAKIGAQASTEAPEADNIPSKVAPGTMGETKGVTIEKPEEKAEEKKQELGSVKDLIRFASTTDLLLLSFSVAVMFGIGAGMTTMLLFFEGFFREAGIAGGLGISLDMGEVRRVVFFMLYLAGGIGLGMFFGCWPTGIVAANQKAAWKKATVKQILRQDVGWYDVSEPAQLATKMADGVTTIFKALDVQSLMAIQGAGMACGGFTIGFLKSWKVATVVICVVPFILGLVGCFFVVLVCGNKIRAKTYAKAGGLANEALFSMRTVTSLGLEEKFVKRYIDCLKAPQRFSILISPLLGFTGAIAQVGMLLLLAAGFIAGGVFIADELTRSSFNYAPSVTLAPGLPPANVTYCAHDNNNTPSSVVIPPATACPAPEEPLQMNCALMGFAGGALGSVDIFGNNMTFLQLLSFDDDLPGFKEYCEANTPPEYQGFQPDLTAGCLMSGAMMIIAVFSMMQGAQGFGTLMGALDPISKGLVGAGSLKQIVERVSPIDGFSEEGAKPSKVDGLIEVKDVTFAYPSAPEHNVCTGYSLTIPAGQTVALCGPSGSGKSTIIGLIERFYDPQSGTVKLDGVDLKTLNVKWLRSQLGLVSQEPVLFMGTVGDNITYGKPGATQAEIEDAAKSANAHGFITSNLANGYDTDVGQGGGKLSGGQKQRVAIARAIIKKPSVLLLDEATSALDNESERIVQAALDEIMAKQKRTTVVIAHRLSTIRNADKIAVIHEGQVVDQGSHDELLSHVDGIYFKLVLAQQDGSAHGGTSGA